MKSAWDNLVAGIADSDSNLGERITQFADSAETAINNIVPAVGTALSSIGIVIKRLAPIALEKIPEIFSDLAPDLGEAALAMVEYVLDAFGDNAGKVLDAGAEWISQFVAGFGEGIPKFLQMALPMLLSFAESLRKGAKQVATAGIELIKGLADGAGKNTSYIVVMAHQIINNLFGAFMDSVPVLFDAGLQLLQSLGEGIGENIPNFIGFILPLIEQFSETFRDGAGNLVDVGIEFILNLAQGIMDSLPMLIEQVPQIIINFAGAINDNAPKLLEGGVQLIWTIIQGIISAIPTLIDNIPKIFEAFIAVWTALNWVNLGRNVIEFISNGIRALANDAPQALHDIGTKAVEWFTSIDWAHAGTQAIDFIKSAILGVATTIPQTVLDIANQAWEWFNGVDWVALGTNIIDGIISGLTAGLGWLKEKAMDVAESALNAAKDFLDIHSPSKKFEDEVGRMIPAGLAIGIDKGAVDAIDSAKKLSKSLFEPFEGLETPTINVTGEMPATSSMRYDTGMFEAIRANNEALVDALYSMLIAAMREQPVIVQIGNREFARIMREANA